MSPVGLTATASQLAATTLRGAPPAHGAEGQRREQPEGHDRDTPRLRPFFDAAAGLRRGGLQRRGALLAFSGRPVQ